MNPSLHLLLAGLLFFIWGVSVPLASLIQQRSSAPERIENTQWARLLSPAYYLVSISTVVYFSIVPIMTKNPVVILLTLASIA